MFLALKEIKDAKLRYGLLTGIVFLIALVVFVLAGLSAGLSDGHKKAVADFNASGFVLNENANQIVTASNLTVDDLNRVQADQTAAVGFYSGALSRDVKEATKDNVSVFGLDAESFIAPKIEDGRLFQENNEIVVSENLADEQDLKINDTVTIGNSDQELTIVGISQATTYSVEPVVYTNVATFQLLKYGAIPEDESQMQINAIAFDASDLSDVLLTQTKESPLSKLSYDTFIDNLPGYTAERLTLGMMVYILILIAAAIVAIFMYVLTLQKKQLFGILKAQGVPTSVLGKSILAQSLLMTFVGTLLAFVITWILSLFFPAGMPFTADLLQWTLYGGILIVMGTLGGLFCLPSVLKIDPVVAIGG
ncbi:ABC transporter permease [Enterococcus timonensis]|uniref:ABC transporter permease n=1 Tax=Enterococcus timonensis TaxID=1852364 RepID=UPI0008DAD0DD|nr:ABC transporter permease [Enterococcus timonensis]